MYSQCIQNSECLMSTNLQSMTLESGKEKFRRERCKPARLSRFPVDQLLWGGLSPWVSYILLEDYLTP